MAVLQNSGRHDVVQRINLEISSPSSAAVTVGPGTGRGKRLQSHGRRRAAGFVAPVAGVRRPRDRRLHERGVDPESQRVDKRRLNEIVARPPTSRTSVASRQTGSPCRHTRGRAPVYPLRMRPPREPPPRPAEHSTHGSTGTSLCSRSPEQSVPTPLCRPRSGPPTLHRMGPRGLPNPVRHRCAKPRQVSCSGSASAT
jgi:hypothetical protein